MTEGKFHCTSCGHDVGAADGFCAFCGAQTGGAPAAREHADCYLALITANVLRLRREWALAETKCSEVLRHDPESAAAHSLMGDILRDQGRYQDAIEWYKMALDKNPANDSDRRKLEAVIDHVFAGEPGRPLDGVRTFLGKGRRGAGKQGPAGRPVCPWTMLTAGVFAATLLVAFSLAVVTKRAASPSALPTAFSPGRRESLGPFIPRPRLAEPEKPAEIVGDIAQIEQLTLEQVRQREARFDPNCRVNAIEIFPKEAAVQVEMSMPAQWSPADARRSMLRAALVAAASAAADARFVAVRVRCAARPPTGPEQVALVAEANADKVRDSADAGHSELAEAAFRTIWWSPALQEGGGEAAPGG